jgi:methionine-gamma-lyase
MRSLETLQMRMMKQAENAAKVAHFLTGHPKVSNLHYLGFIQPDHPQHDIYKRQCLGPGAMIAFDVEGGEAGSFRFLNSLKLIHLAVSLGSTESLAEHPGTMTHSGLSEKAKASYGITDGMARLSVGVEHPDDLILDIRQALDTV